MWPWRACNPCRKACSASRFTTTATATRSVLVHRGQTFGLPHIVRDGRSQEPSAAILRGGAPAQVHELVIIFKEEWPQPYTTGIGEMERLTHKMLHYECCSPGQRTRGILGTSGSGASSSRTRSQSSDSSLACHRRLLSSNASWPVNNRSCMSQKRPCAAAASATSAARCLWTTRRLPRRLRIHLAIDPAIPSQLALWHFPPDDGSSGGGHCLGDP